MSDLRQRPEATLGAFLRRGVSLVWRRWFVEDETTLEHLDLPSEPSLANPALLGLVGMVAVVFGVTRPGSPFVLQESGSWFFGTNPGPGAYASVTGVLLVWGGLIAVARAWLDLFRLTRRSPGIAPRRLYAVIVAWVVPLTLAPSLFSHDVYSYAAQGQLTRLGFSPYHYSVGILGPGSLASFVDPIWRSTPAPYGPVFLWLAARIMGLTAGHVTWAIVGFRALALAGVGAAAYSLPVIARALGTDPATALVAGILNPVVLFGLVGGAHNDAWMVGLVCLAIVFSLRGRHFLGLVFASLAAAVKIPAALAVAFISWEWVGHGAKPGQRIRPLVTGMLILLATLELAGRFTHLGWGWFGALGVPGRSRQILSPTDLVASVLAGVGHFLHVGPSFAGILTMTRALGLLAAGAMCIYLLWRSSRLGTVKALGLAFLVVVALCPVVEPWYLTWGLVLLAALSDAAVRRLVVIVSVAGTFLWLWQNTFAALTGAGQATLVVVSAIGAMTLTRPGWTSGLVDLLRPGLEPEVVDSGPSGR